MITKNLGKPEDYQKENKSDLINPSPRDDHGYDFYVFIPDPLCIACIK